MAGRRREAVPGAPVGLRSPNTKFFPILASDWAAPPRAAVTMPRPIVAITPIARSRTCFAWHHTCHPALSLRSPNSNSSSPSRPMRGALAAGCRRHATTPHCRHITHRPDLCVPCLVRRMVLPSLPPPR